jgi:hypothetical protein
MNAFFYTHSGMGDLIYCIGAIRYLATQFENVYVVVWDKYMHIFNALFNDVKNVHALTTARHDLGALDYIHSNNLGECALFLSGAYKPRSDPVCTPDSPYPYCFYDDMGMPRSIMKDYFHVPRRPDLLQVVGQPYIFIHNIASCLTLDINISTDLFIIDPSNNRYPPGHPHFERAQAFVMLNVIDYVDILENAEELHLIDSCFLALAHQLDLSKVKKKVAYTSEREKVEARNGDHLNCAKTFKIFEIV